MFQMVQEVELWHLLLITASEAIISECHAHGLPYIKNVHKPHYAAVPIALSKRCHCCNFYSFSHGDIKQDVFSYL